MTPSTGGLRLFGAVFAGGRSDRMGVDKASLRWPAPDGGAVTLLERAATTLDGLCERVEVSAGQHERYAESGRPTFPDVRAGQGPLAGLVAALERASDLGLDAVVALACDMPLVSRGELSRLVAAMGGAEAPMDAALWVVGDREQPLCAVYRTTCAEPARRAFEAGARRLVAIFDDGAAQGRPLRLERLHADENSALRLVNVNTKTDYDRALRDATRGARRATGPAAEDFTSPETDHRDGPER